jgi:hypothetical protein
MFELYLSHTSAGEHSTDPRNQFHDVALREARIASDWFAVECPADLVEASRPSLVSRLRLAFARPVATTDACSCPA